MKQNLLHRVSALILTLAMLLSLIIIPAAAVDGEMSVTLKVGATQELKVQDLDNTTGETVTSWVSSDESIASVDSNGLVTAKKVGETIITATVAGNISTELPDSGTTKADTTRKVKFEVKVTNVVGITLDSKTLSLVAGRTAQLTATITPTTAQDEKVTWVSSNTDIAIVASDGTVTAMKEGTATITAQAGASKDDCVVTVTAAVPVTSIHFTNTTSTNVIQVNRSDAKVRDVGFVVDPLGATFTYDDVQWNTENPEIARVEKNSGITTGRGAVLTIGDPGETYVVVTIGDVTAKCKVIVSGIRLSSSTLTITEGKTEILSTDGIFGAAATTDLLQWSSSDPSVVTVNGGKLTARAPGNATITVEKGSYTAQCVVTVVEDISALIDAGSVNAGTPLSLNQDRIRRELNEISIKKTETETVAGVGLDYITSLNVTPTQGIVHNGYIFEGDTGSGVAMGDKFYMNPSNTSQADMTKLYFVPKSDYSGPAEISFMGVAKNKQTFNGTIRVMVNAMDDVHYAASVDTPYNFESNDFNNVCRTRMGRDLNYVTFTLPNSKDGTLYYDYRGTSEYATKVTSTTHYKRSGSPYIDQISFVPAKGFTGDVTIDYRGIDTSGAAYNGKLTITVSDRSITEGGDINYRTPKDTALSFITRDFTGILERGTLDYIRFDTLPTSSQGSLRYDYRNSSNTGTAVTTSQRYFRTGSQNLIADLSFIPASDFEGQVKLEFTAYNTSGERFSGTVSIEVGETTGGRTVRYEVGSGRSVRFVAADFNEACLGVLNKPITRIQFEDLPSSSRGTLYLNYNTSTGRGTAVKSKTNYYYNSSPRISDLTFVSNGGYSGTVRIGFTGYTGSGSDEKFTGTVEIMVSAGTPNVTYYSTTNAGTVRLNGSTLASACNGVMSGNLSYIQFTGLPASSVGHLYRNYNGFNTGTQVSTGTQYYVNGNPSIDQLTFVPRNTFQGVARLSYTGYSTSGEQVSGRIDITVSNGGLTSSFNDMGNHSWANASVNYLASNGVVNGIGNGNYGPGLNIHRCDFVVMLCRAFGFNTGSNDSGFDDVPADSYYSQAVATAKRLGIVSGTGGNNFTPNGQLTRQDGMLMVRNALSTAGWSISSDPAVLGSFEDGGTVSSYARNAVSALVQLGVVSGDSNGRLRPHDPITRAELAVLLHHIMTM